MEIKICDMFANKCQNIHIPHMAKKMMRSLISIILEWKEQVFLKYRVK